MCEKTFMTADDLQYFDDASRANFANIYRDDVMRLNVQNGLKACGSPLYSARKLEQWKENECFLFYLSLIHI